MLSRASCRQASLGADLVVSLSALFDVRLFLYRQFILRIVLYAKVISRLEDGELIVITHSFKERLDASSEDILEFLERDVQYIRSPVRESRQNEYGQSTIGFYGIRQGNVVSIYRKSCDTEGGESEIIRFQAVQGTKSTSVVEASCVGDNSYVVLIFYRIWARLAIAFDAGFAGQALNQLQELQSQKR